MLVGGTQCAALAPVVVINHKTNGHPDEKADPIHDGEAGHQKATSKNRQSGSYWPSRRAKSSMAIRFAVAENQHASGHQREGKQRSDGREDSKGSDIEQPRGNTHNKASHPSGEDRRLIQRMDAPKKSREKDDAGQSDTNARTAKVANQQGTDHAQEHA